MAIQLTGSFALAGQRYYRDTSHRLATALERLSTGSRVNRASDGAAGRLVAENYQSQINAGQAVQSGIQEGLAMLNIASEGLFDINDHLQGLRQVAMAAANSTTTATQYAKFSQVVQGEMTAMNTLAITNKYKGLILLNGSVLANVVPMDIQIGPYSGDKLDIQFAFTPNYPAPPGLNISTTTLTNSTDATALLGEIDTALSIAQQNMATIDGYHTQLTDALNQVAVLQENAAAEASIQEVDLASETSQMARLQILQQAALFAQAQANTSASLALQLLK